MINCYASTSDSELGGGKKKKVFYVSISQNCSPRWYTASVNSSEGGENTHTYFCSSSVKRLIPSASEVTFMKLVGGFCMFTFGLKSCAEVRKASRANCYPPLCTNCCCAGAWKRDRRVGRTSCQHPRRRAWLIRPPLCPCWYFGVGVQTCRRLGAQLERCLCGLVYLSALFSLPLLWINIHCLYLSHLHIHDYNNGAAFVSYPAALLFAAGLHISKIKYMQDWKKFHLLTFSLLVWCYYGRA